MQLQHHNPGSQEVVAVIYNMSREAPRTLHSLSAAYQRHINPDGYEVIVVDNGSNPPFDQKIIEGLAEAQGDVIGVMIDGARMVTPGLLHLARHGAGLYDNTVVATLGWYLGNDFQGWSMQCGYNQAREDQLRNSATSRCRPWRRSRQETQCCSQRLELCPIAP